MQEITCVFLQNLRVLFLKYVMLTYKEINHQVVDNTLAKKILPKQNFNNTFSNSESRT